MLSLAICFLTSAAVWIGVLLGMHLLKQCTVHPDSVRMNANDFYERLGPWDGVWFRQIATNGYSYAPDRMSSVAFYPLYPLLGRIVTLITGSPIQKSLFAVSQLSLVGCFALFAMYLSGGSPGRQRAAEHTLISLGLFPTTFYLRMSYTESTFLLCCLLVFVGMQRRWPIVLLGLFVGLSTSIRPVGIALVPVLICHAKTIDSRPWHVLVRLAYLLPLSVSGIASYMIYQHFAFGDALAFAKTQIHWYERTPPSGFARLVALLTLEPIRAVFDPDSICYWAKVPPYNLPLFNMHFMNPVIVLSTWITLAIGWWKRWLNAYELLFCFGVLFIPYATHAYRGCMCSNARYALIAFPQFIVYGHMLSNLAPVSSTILLSLSSVFLTFFSALFVSWYWFY